MICQMSSDPKFSKRPCGSAPENPGESADTPEEDWSNLPASERVKRAHQRAEAAAQRLYSLPEMRGVRVFPPIKSVLKSEGIT